MKRISREKRRRGAALESAIVFMVVVFTLCLLLTSVMIVARQNTRLSQSRIERTAFLDQIGEDYLSALRNGTELDTSYEDYEYTATENELTVWKKNDSTKKPLLRVEAEYISGEVRVHAWHNTAAQ